MFIGTHVILTRHTGIRLLLNVCFNIHNLHNIIMYLYLHYLQYLPIQEKV